MSLCDNYIATLWPQPSQCVYFKNFATAYGTVRSTVAIFLLFLSANPLVAIEKYFGSNTILILSKRNSLTKE
jgi:hypothetical protein